MKIHIALLLIIVSVGFTSNAQWITLDSHSSVDMYEVFFANDSIGYMTDNNGDILKTVDGGVQWTTNTPLLGGLYFLSPDTGFASSSGIYKTVNGAISWSKMTSINDAVSGVSFPSNGNI